MNPKEAFARILLRLLAEVPLPLLSVFFESVMMLVCAADRVHRRVARINLRIAFPGVGDSDAGRIIRACYRNLGTSAAEFVHIPKMDETYLQEHFRIEGAEWIRESLQEKDRPVIVMTGHFGNWELLSHVYGKRIGPVAFIVRPLKSAILDRIVTERRECSGNTFAIRKEGSAREVIKILKKRVLVGILIDQNVSRSLGVPVEFFGVKAYTTFGIARIALAMNAAIHPGFIFRDPMRKFHHTIRFGPAIPIDPRASREEEVERVCRRCNEELEKAIRQAPEQWLWFHRRWKNRPEGMPDIYGRRK